MTERSREFESAYRKAIYIVIEGKEKRIFRIGDVSAAVDEILKNKQAARFAFITAYNPRSKEMTQTENETRQKELEQSLRAAGHEFLHGCGTSENGTWKPEKSVFVFDISKPEAVKIGREFGQNAIVYGEKGGEIELMWCKEENTDETNIRF